MRLGYRHNSSRFLFFFLQITFTCFRMNSIENFVVIANATFFSPLNRLVGLRSLVSVSVVYVLYEKHLNAVSLLIECSAFFFFIFCSPQSAHFIDNDIEYFKRLRVLPTHIEWFRASSCYNWPFDFAILHLPSHQFVQSYTKQFIFKLDFHFQ